MQGATTIQKVGPLIFFLALTAFSLVFVLTGCDSGPLSLEQLDQQEETGFFDLPYNPEAMAKSDQFTVDTVESYQSLITVEEGGVVILSSTESVELRTYDDGTDSDALVDVFVVQPYSIATDEFLVLEVTKIVTYDGEMPIIFDCSPDGLVFSNPAILLINVWENFGKTATGINLYWLDEETGEWVFEAQIDADPVTGQAPALIHHFSKYGIEGDQPTSKGGGPPTNVDPGGGKADV